MSLFACVCLCLCVPQLCMRMWLCCAAQCVACVRARSIPLCPAPWSPGLFLSRDLRGPAGAGAPTVSCAGAAGAASRAPDALALSLPTAWLLPGAVYAVVGYRSAGSDAVTAPAAVAVAVEGVFEYTSAFVGPARALRGARGVLVRLCVGVLGAAGGSRALEGARVPACGCGCV